MDVKDPTIRNTVIPDTEKTRGGLELPDCVMDH